VWKLSKTLFAICRPLGGYCGVDGAVSPGSTAKQDQLPPIGSDIEVTADLGLLTLAEMFHALPEQPAYADNCG
jgi:hypothetical protein